MAVRNKSGLEDNLGDDEIFRIRPRRNTLENLPQELLAKVDGGKLSKQGRIDKLLAQKTPAEVRLDAAPRTVLGLRNHVHCNVERAVAVAWSGIC
jgi:hypothetical protein